MQLGPSSCLILELRDEFHRDVELPSISHLPYEDSAIRNDKEEVTIRIREVLNGPRHKIGLRSLDSINREMFSLWGEYQEWRKKADKID